MPFPVPSLYSFHFYLRILCYLISCLWALCIHITHLKCNFSVTLLVLSLKEVRYWSGLQDSISILSLEGLWPLLKISWCLDTENKMASAVRCAITWSSWHGWNEVSGFTLILFARANTPKSFCSSLWHESIKESGRNGHQIMILDQCTINLA